MTEPTQPQHDSATENASSPDQPALESTPPEHEIASEAVTPAAQPTAESAPPSEAAAPAPADATQPDEPAGDAPPQEEEVKPPVPNEVMQERLERLRRKQKRVGPVPTLRHEPLSFSNVSVKEGDDELERQLEEAMGGMSEQEMYSETATQRGQAAVGPKGGKKGKIVQVHGGDVFVQIPGSRSEGVLPVTQFPEGKPEIGTEVEVEIDGYDPANGLLILARKGAAVADADWSSIAPSMVVEARVTETNKGGLTVVVNGIRGFMPISQIDLFRVEKTEDYVNQKLLCMVTQVDQANRNLVVSRRELLEREREEKREKLWQELAEGQVRDGVVRSVQNFGAFVDLGGVDGLLHVSEMSWMRVKHPSDVVQPGQAIKVAILKIDHDRRRISLGLKQLEPSPWDDAEEKYKPGRLVDGKVVKLMDFGAFVELEPGVEGLIPVSELASHRVHRVAEVVQLDQELQLQVLNFDKERRRISLSLKGAQSQPAGEEQTIQGPQESAATEKKPPRRKKIRLRGGIGSEMVDEDE